MLSRLEQLAVSGRILPGVKALFSIGVGEGLLVATGLAGVGAWALRFLLDGDGRAVECHC